MRTLRSTSRSTATSRRGTTTTSTSVSPSHSTIGLIAPALLDAGAKPLAQIARETKDLVARARGGSLRPDEITAGTFCVTNLGAYGIEALIGIIQPPQTAILGVGSVAQQAIVRDGAIVAREMMKVALSADHRVTDGAQGAQFLAEIKRLLEQPQLLVK